ncbi:MAG TPA: glycosyltransferase family 4 protein [Solirubrobacterales bacterium]|nr:glycosyltransferase family 4 protein [Solirubrobacterales bacterium]
MRVLTIGSLPPEWGGPERGGVATFHASLLTGLLGHRADVEVVGAMPPSPLDREVPVPIFVRPEAVSRADFYANLLERMQPDVVLMNHIAHTVGVTHARLRPPVPAVGVVHSWHSVTFAPGEEERGRAWAVTQEAMGGLGALVAPSHHALAEGRDLSFHYPAIASVIHNPLPPLYMDEEIDANAHRRHGVLYLGGLIPRKDPVALLEAAALLPALDVTLVGQGQLEEALRSQIEARDLGGRVRLAGALPGAGHLAQVRDLLLRAQALCLPSRSESFGLVFAEALACGTPIVGFGPTVREIRETMGIEVGEPLDRSTPVEISAAIERALAATWDRQELRRATLEAFGLPRVTDRYLELFSRVASRQAAGSHGQP